MPSSRILSLALLTLGLAAVVVPPATAYIDAGTGGMVLQALLAGIAGAAVVIRMYWKRIVGYFRSEK